MKARNVFSATILVLGLFAVTFLSAQADYPGTGEFSLYTPVKNLVVDANANSDVTVTIMRPDTVPTLKSVVITWSGEGSTTATLAGITGTIARVDYLPGTVRVPTTGYDVTMLDAYGFDILGGSGSNLDDADALTTAPLLNSQLISTVGPVILSVTDTGTTASGTIRLLLR